MFLTEPDRSLIMQAIDTHANTMRKSGSSYQAVEVFHALYDKVQTVDPASCEEIELLTSLARECEKIADDEVEAVEDEDDECGCSPEQRIECFVSGLTTEELPLTILAIHARANNELRAIIDAGMVDRFVNTLTYEQFVKLRHSMVARILKGECSEEAVDALKAFADSVSRGPIFRGDPIVGEPEGFQHPEETVGTFADYLNRAKGKVLGVMQLQTTTKDQLRTIVERIERLNEEQSALAADLKEVYAEAKGNGFDVKAIRAVVALRKKDENKRREEEAVLDTYLHALGMAPEAE